MSHRSLPGAWSFAVLLLGVGSLPAEFPSTSVRVELMEKIPDKRSWQFQMPAPVTRYTKAGFGFVGVPAKWSDKGLLLDRSNPFALRARTSIAVAGGEYRLLLRARGAARLWIDGKVVAQTRFIRPNGSAHERVPQRKDKLDANLYPLPAGHQQQIKRVSLKKGVHRFRLDAIIGGKRVRAEIGELVVGIARKGESFRLLSTQESVPLDEQGWVAHGRQLRVQLEQWNTANRKKAGVAETQYWAKRHVLARQVWKHEPAPVIPSVSKDIPVQNAIDRFIGQRLQEEKVKPAALTDDWTFLRRVTLDTVGVIPTVEEIQAFQADQKPGRRSRVIDRLLADRRWADHWVPYWQDVLAENPGILKPMLNNTGPFRFYILRAFRDNLPVDRFASELIQMEGSKYGGGPAGFALATQNDVPMAAKAHVIAKAFLGVELKCARCHDAPYHPYTQKMTFQVASLLRRAPLAVPKTSSVPVPPGGRRPRVEVTLKPGQKVKPAWPFPKILSEPLPVGLVRKAGDTREELAARITSPHNERFVRVMVNRLWKRYLGWGLVEPVDDWTLVRPSHPQLLDYLARELVLHDYDLKHVARLILNSHAYQRKIVPEGSREAIPEQRFFASPARRRVSAEQLVDSLFLVAGKEFRCEQLTMDPEGRRSRKIMLNLGRPQRAWEFTSLSNERDRPALALPVAQSIVDLLKTYGWRASRPSPLTVRNATPTPLQPALLANGVVGRRITRLSDDSALTELCLQKQSLPALIRSVFRRVLTRLPTPEEEKMFTELLHKGYDKRRVPGARKVRRKRTSTHAVSWSNHLSPEATRLKLELERLAQAGDPPTARLRGDWRERMEDMVWVLINSPEFLFVP